MTIDLGMAEAARLPTVSRAAAGNRSIPSVFFRGFHHGMQVVRVPLANRSTARKNKAAARGANLNEFSGNIPSLPWDLQ